MKIRTWGEAKQAAFNGAYRGLSQQGFVGASKPDGSGCLLRGAGKTCCAAGWLAVEEKLPPDYRRSCPIEDRLGGTTTTLFVNRALATPLQEYANRGDKEREALGDFISRLQCAHDCASGPEEMRASLLDIAKKERLTVPAELPVTVFAKEAA